MIETPRSDLRLSSTSFGTRPPEHGRSEVAGNLLEDRLPRVHIPQTGYRRRKMPPGVFFADRYLAEWQH
jgi:hypothetical protein